MDVHNLRGEQGGVFIDGTTEQTPAAGHGYWLMAVAVTDVTIAALEMPHFENSDALIGVSLVAGTPIYGRINSIQLTTGTLQVFRYDERVRV